MILTSFRGNNGGLAALIVLIVLVVGIVFSSVRMNIDGKIERYKREAAISTVEIEKKNQVEIEGY